MKIVRMARVSIMEIQDSRVTWGMFEIDMGGLRAAGHVTPLIAAASDPHPDSRES